jgi:stage III sporulation protein SpoIIIAA
VPYEDVFDALTRALYRRAAHIALVGDRGVGQHLLLAELARRAAFGQYRTLHDRRFVRVDCRYTAPQHSASRLTAILKLTCERPDVIVCVHGFA